MATTFRLDLDNRKRTDGRYCIYIRICQERRYKRVKSSVSVEKKEYWNPKARYGCWIRSKDPACAAKNQKLIDEIDALKKLYDKEKVKGKVSINKLAEAKKKEDVSPRFLPYAEKITEDIKATGHIRNAKKYRRSIRTFAISCGRSIRT